MWALHDISRAQTLTKNEREFYIVVPKEQLTDEDGDVVGRSHRNIYRFRDATNGWFEGRKAFLTTHNYQTGIANPALFHNLKRCSRRAFHGDVFDVLRRRRDFDDVTSLWNSKHSDREIYCLGSGQCSGRDSAILNRVIKLGCDECRRKLVKVKPDVSLIL